MEGRKLLKEFWWLILLLAALFTFGVFFAVYNQPSEPGTVSNCIVQAAGPAQGYGPTDQSVTCKSSEFGVISVTTPKIKIYSVGQSIQVIGYEGQLFGRSYRVSE